MPTGIMLIIVVPMLLRSFIVMEAQFARRIFHLLLFFQGFNWHQNHSFRFAHPVVERECLLLRIVHHSLLLLLIGLGGIIFSWFGVAKGMKEYSRRANQQDGGDYHPNLDEGKESLRLDHQHRVSISASGRRSPSTVTMFHFEVVALSISEKAFIRRRLVRGAWLFVGWTLAMGQQQARICFDLFIRSPDTRRRLFHFEVACAARYHGR
mmetsp:Transcript_23054/g.35093  ORF Transcript_23054/g.35093 Transcript_23054/m.35093 type:complete len:209 (+) Transcript_23054:371-997(+)